MSEVIIDIDTNLEVKVLREKNKILLEALKLADEELQNRDNGKTFARSKIQNIKNLFGIGAKKTYSEFFIKQALKRLKE